MTFTRHLRILSLAAAALALATPAFALNPQPLPPGMRFNPAAVNHAQGAGAWNRGPIVLRCHAFRSAIRVRIRRCASVRDGGTALRHLRVDIVVGGKRLDGRGRLCATCKTAPRAVLVLAPHASVPDVAHAVRSHAGWIHDALRREWRSRTRDDGRAGILPRSAVGQLLHFWNLTGWNVSARKYCAGICCGFTFPSLTGQFRTSNSRGSGILPVMSCARSQRLRRASPLPRRTWTSGYDSSASFDRTRH